MLLVLLGVVAGVLTTVAGLGGGMLLLLTVSLMRTPSEALGLTAPALLLSNLHRAVLYRGEIDRRIAQPLIAAIVPGSLLGGFLLPVLPTWLIQFLMISMTALALARSLGLWKWNPTARSLAPAGFGIGALAATSGGAGMLLSPLLLASGLSGERYIATTAASAVAMHAGRVIAYGASGIVNATTLRESALLLAALLVGNALGARLRKTLSPKAAPRIELGSLLIAVMLSLAGLHG